MVLADHVQCGYCEEIMYVVRGSEVCPKCKYKGGLAWADPENEEVEVYESDIVNWDDYENVINDREEYINK